MLDKILENQGGFYGTDKTAKNDALGKDAFLKLLITQLQHQDPLNPLDDKEFIAQLAQFSSLEQMNNISEGINALVNKTQAQDMLNSVNYIGKEVVASGSSVSKFGEAVSPVFFTLNGPASEVQVNVYDNNNNLIRSEKLAAMQAGEFQYLWDGRDYTGAMADNGSYNVYFSAEGPKGEPVFVDTEVSGTIMALERIDGATHFRLNDGRKVAFADIKKVVQPTVAE
jgi:flagellar basal-body rod modification protein FlgD